MCITVFCPAVDLDRVAWIQLPDLLRLPAGPHPDQNVAFTHDVAGCGDRFCVRFIDPVGDVVGSHGDRDADHDQDCFFHE